MGAGHRLWGAVAALRGSDPLPDDEDSKARRISAFGWRDRYLLALSTHPESADRIKVLLGGVQRDRLRKALQPPPMPLVFEACPRQSWRDNTKGGHGPLNDLVCAHVISEAQGGAPHANNYYPCGIHVNAIAALKHDPLNCAHVGWVKTRGAIEISHSHGQYEMATDTYNDDDLYMLDQSCKIFA